MKNRQLDAVLKRALRAGTDGAAARKQAVWRAVASGAEKIDAERDHEDMRRKRNKLLGLTGAAAAVALAAVFFLLTPDGTALAGRLVKLFAPEKRITTDIEGAKETQNAQLAQNTAGEIVRSGSVATATAAPGETPKPDIRPGKLTWETLAVRGAVLDTEAAQAVEALKAAFGEPSSEVTSDDLGGTARSLTWSDGTAAVIRSGKLYSIETTNPDAAMPNGLRVGLTLDDFTTALGEPHEAVNGALAWGVGSNDNLIVTVVDGIVTKMKISLIE